MIGVCCPNPYYYVDLDTYTCTNHFLYMVDGWALKTVFKVGHGSSGSIVDCHGNWTYWIDNYDSQSCLRGDQQPPVMDFIAHNLESFVLGDCTELLVKNFNIPGNTFVVARAQNGRGPNATLISDYCDAMIRGFVLDITPRKQAEKAYAADTRAGTFKGCTEFHEFEKLLERPDVDPAHPHIWYESCAVCGGAYLDAGEFRDEKSHSIRGFFRDLFARPRA